MSLASFKSETTYYTHFKYGKYFFKIFLIAIFFCYRYLSKHLSPHIVDAPRACLWFLKNRTGTNDLYSAFSIQFSKFLILSICKNNRDACWFCFKLYHMPHFWRIFLNKLLLIIKLWLKECRRSYCIEYILKLIDVSIHRTCK